MRSTLSPNINSDRKPFDMHVRGRIATWAGVINCRKTFHAKYFPSHAENGNVTECDMNTVPTKESLATVKLFDIHPNVCTDEPRLCKRRTVIREWAGKESGREGWREHSNAFGVRGQLTQTLRLLRLAQPALFGKRCSSPCRPWRRPPTRRLVACRNRLQRTLRGRWHHLPPPTRRYRCLFPNTLS
jgi:hypothetical protein